MDHAHNELKREFATSFFTKHKTVVLHKLPTVSLLEEEGSPAANSPE